MHGWSGWDERECPGVPFAWRGSILRGMAGDIRTRRLDLVCGGAVALEAELRSPTEMAAVLGAVVASDWPPEHWDAGPIRWILDKLAAGGPVEWWSPRYIVLREGAQRMVVGGCGFKGPPGDGGEVELGYGVVRSHHRRGIASEAVGGLVRWAWQDARVRLIVGQTLADGVASQGVLLKNGFVFAGAGSDPDEDNVVRYELARG